MSANGGGGGAGGGALVIASSSSITVNGSIQARGGNGGGSGPGGFAGGGGGGSGGAIRLVAPTLEGSGTLNATGGTGAGGNFGVGGNGSSGRIRLEAFQHGFAGSASPLPPLASPVSVFLSGQPPPPVIQVVSVDGIPVVNPSASLTMPDATIESNSPVTVEFRAQNIPVGTVVQLTLVSENAPDQIIDSTPLTGTQDSLTGTVTVDRFPPGFSRGFLHAKWSQ